MSSTSSTSRPRRPSPWRPARLPDRQAGGQDAETILVYDLGGGTFDVTTLMEIDGNQIQRPWRRPGTSTWAGVDWDRRSRTDWPTVLPAKYRGMDPRDRPGRIPEAPPRRRGCQADLDARGPHDDPVRPRGRGSAPMSAVRVRGDDRRPPGPDPFTTVRNPLREAGVEPAGIDPTSCWSAARPGCRRSERCWTGTGRQPDRSLWRMRRSRTGRRMRAGPRRSSDPDHLMTVRRRQLARPGSPTRHRARDGPTPHEGDDPPQHAPAGLRRPASSSTSGRPEECGGPDRRGWGCQRQQLHPYRYMRRPGSAARPAPGMPVDVAFSYGQNGRLTVQARLPDLGQEASMLIKRDSGLSDVEAVPLGPAAQERDASCCSWIHEVPSERGMATRGKEVN